MEPVTFTPEVIGAIVGLFLTLTFAYFPKFRVWYGGLATEVKSYVMIGMLFTSAAIIWVLSFYGIIPVTEPINWLSFCKVLLALLVANQPVYQIIPEAKDVIRVKATRDELLTING